MATMKDIARIAGVSHGTVSNVLNGRGNVSVEKMEAVLNAARQSGYSVNTQAQLLRSNTSNKIAIVLPQITLEKFSILFNSLRQAIDGHGELHFDLYLTDDLESKENRVIQKIASGGYRFVVAVSCLPDASLYFESLQIEPENIAFIYRKPKGAKVFLSLDYKQIADGMVQQMNLEDINVVGVYADENRHNHTHSDEFVDSIRKCIQKKKSDIEIIAHYSSDSEAYKTAFDFFSSQQSADIVITQDIEKMRYITQASHFGSTKNSLAVYTLCGSTPPMITGLFCFPVNYAQLGQDIINYLLNDKFKPQDINFRIPNISNRIYTGSQQSKTKEDNKSSLNLLTLPSPSTNALQKLLPHFQRLTGITVNLSIRPFSEIFDILSNIEEYLYYDLLRIDVAFFPWFAEQSLLPLSQVGTGLTDLLSKYTSNKQQRFSQVKGIPYALPLDASVQLLFYRKDLFEDAVIKRMFFESTGKELKPPVTFSEYDLISRFFYNHKEMGNTMRPYGSSTTTGSAGIVSTEFLLRYYAAGGKLISANGSPCLDINIAQTVLNEYIRQIPFSERINSEWWSESITHFEKGELAMNIAYMNLFNDVAHSEMSSNIGFAPVPGGIPQIGGGVLGVSKYSSKTDFAEQFFRWLYSGVIMDHIVMLGGNTIQRDVIYSQEIKHRYPWLSLAYDEISSGVRESTLLDGKPFNLRRAEIIIGRGVINASDGIMTNHEVIENINESLSQLEQ